MGVVERGLYIQLGEAGAKTEAQLGEVQLEAAKRLRHVLATNKCVLQFMQSVSGLLVRTQGDLIFTTTLVL